MYNHQEIEKKWQKIWADSGLYRTGEDPAKPKYYILDMFPYPSGAGLHVGHPKGYIATDILARRRLMQGYNVLHPMGWDAFGLPAENYALKNKVHPREATEKNVATFKRQVNMLGLSYDWEREINTTDPAYYKWTQWIFLKMWGKGLAYESREPINWCPSCQTGLANEDLENGKCERCGSEVEQKPLRQWVLKITKYADRLLDDLEKLDGWEESIKEMQRNWIGRSEGAEIDFKIQASGEDEKENNAEEKSERENSEQQSKAAEQQEAVQSNDKIIKVFTTRVDTIFGCTYVVLAPENNLVAVLKSSIKNWPAVEKYLEATKNKTDLQRTDLNKEKTGVILEGVKAVNPFNNEAVDVFVADYVLNSYGTGAVMAVPAHDERDYEFAQKYNLEIREVIAPANQQKQTDQDKLSNQKKSGEVSPSLVDESNSKIVVGYNNEAFTADGVLVDSGNFSGLASAEARSKMTDWLEKKKCGAKKINYKLKDWVFSRQRYWGEPIPLIHCEHCGVVAVPEKDLPVRLPEVKSYEPTGTGESPLAAITDWVNTVCPKCGGPAKRETNTMPQWGGSCWYYLRYIDPRNDQALVDKTKEKYWSPVDFYVGGAEHATRHLIYARFWHKFLYDIGTVSHAEPFTKLKHVGLIMGEDSRKMSKRWGNVINPDDMVEQFGADALRLYEMFMGPFDQATAWNTKGLIGARKFLEKVIGLTEALSEPGGASVDAMPLDASAVARGAMPAEGTIKDSAPAEEVTQKGISVKETIEPELRKLESLLHKTIKKVSADIESFALNTAVSALMILANEMAEYRNKTGNLSLGVAKFGLFLKILAPFAPHLAEELWEKIGNQESIFKSVWPEYDSELIKDEIVSLVVQINGKLRATLEVAADISEEDALAAGRENDNVKKWLEGREIIKTIFVPGKLLNIVVK